MTDARRTFRPLTVVDLFAGCGGLTEGFHEYRPVGVDHPVFFTVGAVEWDPAAAATFTANFEDSYRDCPGASGPPRVFCEDITGWTPPWGRDEIDVVVGGPPCQGFSGLNRERVRAERNTLWQEFIRVVVALQPKVFVIENVDRFLRSVEFQDLNSRLEGSDLDNYELVDPGNPPGAEGWARDRQFLLNAADFGSPQARRRAIVMGVRKDAGMDYRTLKYPAPTHSRQAGTQGALSAGSSELKPWVAADGVFQESAELHLAFELPSRPPVTLQGIPGAHAGPYTMTELHVRRRPEQISLSRYQAIPPCGNRNDLRGRYACRLEDGSELIIEHSDHRRDPRGQLVPRGTHRVVVNGRITGEELSIEEATRVFRATPVRRSVEERFDALVNYGGRRQRADLEYLSTPSWDAHRSGSGDVMGRVRPGEPAVTIRTEFFKPEKGRYLHASENRALTHFEAALLQGFPLGFKWHGSRTEIARQIGNAVPIPLGRAIAGAIYDYLRGAAVTEPPRRC